MIETVRSIAALRARIAEWRSAGRDGRVNQTAPQVALVPTMGALHLGHLALVKAARARAQHVVVSLFVNPTQFGPNEDFTRYPRDEVADARALAVAQADLLYAPTTAEMYPEGFATTVTLAGLSGEMEGSVRPHHFAGVATVVAKLLNQAQADTACFGEKDYQQLHIVRRLARDLDIATRIVGVPTVRDVDGLALSSRNAYLGPEERKIAPILYRTLHDLAAALEAGEGPTTTLLERARQKLLSEGFGGVDYLDLRDAETLARLDKLDRPGRLLAAVRLGRTRLIDNVPVSPAG